MSGTPARQPSKVVVPASQNGGLKKIPPYWYPYTTMAKERWLGREILEIVSTEFRDRSMEYYVSPLIASLPFDHDGWLFHVEICSRIWRHYHQRKGRETRYSSQERGPY